jgi:hypothetical protein
MRQLTPISSARLERSHSTTGPTKDRFQLRDRHASIRRARRRNLAESVRRAIDTSCTTRLAKLIAEGSLVERMTSRADDESKIAAGAGAQCLREHRKYRQRYLDVGLLGLDRCNAIADVLAP